MDLLTLLTTLTLGNYGFTAWVFREVLKTRHNHVKHLEDRVKAVEDKLSGSSDR